MVTHTSGAVVAPKERRLLLRLHMSISHACILCGAQSEHVAAAGSAAQRTAGQVSSCPPAGAAHCHRILSADAGPHSTGSRHPTVARAPDNECASTCPHLQVRLISHRVLPALGVEEGGGEEGGGLRRRGVSKGGGAQTCSRRVSTCLGFHLVRHWELAVLSPTHNVASDQSASSKTSAGQASPPPCSPPAASPAWARGQSTPAGRRAGRRQPVLSQLSSQCRICSADWVAGVRRCATAGVAEGCVLPAISPNRESVPPLRPSCQGRRRRTPASCARPPYTPAAPPMPHVVWRAQVGHVWDGALVIELPHSAASTRHRQERLAGGRRSHA